MKSYLLILSCLLLIAQFNNLNSLSVSDLIDDLSKELEDQFGLANETSSEDGIGK